LFCGGCTSKSISIVKFRFDTPVRVCDDCYVLVEKETYPILDPDLGLKKPGVRMQTVPVGQRKDGEGKKIRDIIKIKTAFKNLIEIF